VAAPEKLRPDDLSVKPPPPINQTPQ
jgi:hypothetical protein